MRKKTVYKIIFVLLILSLLSSFILSFKNITEICDPSEGCSVVNDSSYSETFGIKNSVYGSVIFFCLLIVMILYFEHPRHKHLERIIHYSIFAGAIIALYFIFLQFFVIHAFCKYCMVVDISLLLSSGLLLYLRWKT